MTKESNTLFTYTVVQSGRYWNVLRDGKVAGIPGFFSKEAAEAAAATYAKQEAVARGAIQPDFTVTHWDTVTVFNPVSELAKAYKGLLTVAARMESVKISQLLSDGFIIAGIYEKN